MRASPIPVQGAALCRREVGRGMPMILLHGGPDFDISYLLPELDRLSDKFHLIYYDQRRGRSDDYVKPEDVTLDSEMADLDLGIPFSGSSFKCTNAIRCPTLWTPQDFRLVYSNSTPRPLS